MADNEFNPVQSTIPDEKKDLYEKVIKAIKTVYDPEIPVDIWELGLIYDIQITEENEVVVLMTLTAPNCPEAGGLPIEVEEAIKSIPDVKDAKVLITFDPPWDRSRMSDIARFELGLF
ncbi:MAG: iron-sulfur cluster assembly protein [Candidatus Kapaibacteriota bacterium]